MNSFEGVEFDWMPIIAPLIILFITMFGIVFIYSLLFKWLPKALYNFLIGPVALCGLYIWMIPMKIGFYDFFK